MSVDCDGKRGIRTNCKILDLERGAVCLYEWQVGLEGENHKYWLEHDCETPGTYPSKDSKTGNTQFPSGNMKYENLELSKEKEMTFIKSDSCFCKWSTLLEAFGITITWLNMFSHI